MPVIDMEGTIVPDYWIEGQLPDCVAAEPLLLPLAMIAELSPGEVEASRPLGVRIPPGAEIDRLLATLDHVELVVIEFPTFRDGRGFTLATSLRTRHGYKGELRAAGQVLPDQLDALRQCGFTTVETSTNHPPQQWRFSLRAAEAGGPLLKRLLGNQDRAKLHLRSQ